MKLKNLILLGIIPLLLMAYGWYLGQLHQSMQDLAGILLFITGSVGWVLAFGLRWSLRRFAWRDAWWVSLLTGLAGCSLVFAGMVIYAQVHG